MFVQVIAHRARQRGHDKVFSLTFDQEPEFDPAFVAARCVVLPAGNLEDQLLADGWEADLRSILQGLGHADATTITPVVLKERLTRNKIPYAAALALRLRADATLAPRMAAAYPLFPNLI